MPTSSPPADDTRDDAVRDAVRDDTHDDATLDDTAPHVAVVACGGTIASEPDDAGAAPEKTGEDLVAAVPGVADHATVTAHEVCSQPGFDVRWRDVFATAAAACEPVADGADGVVVTHGTDTLADTAFALDLLTDLDAPVVVTGAQRRLDEPSSDAPANLTVAVRAAADSRFAPGVHVAFDDELHAARDVVKGHSNALSTMTAPAKGPVASFTRAAVQVHREPHRATGVSALADAFDLQNPNVDPTAAVAHVPEVPVVHSGTGAGAGQLDRALGAEAVGGVVVEGTGLGNVTAALGDRIGEALDEDDPLPVVVSGRPVAGPTEPVYGTPGGAVTLADHGVVFAGDLPAAKARVALALGLAAGLEQDRLAALFEPPVQRSGSR